MSTRPMTPEDYDQLVEGLKNCRQKIPLTQEQIEALAHRARIREVWRGQIVIRQGEESDEFYFVISGQLRAADTSGETPRLLNFHAARAFVGEQGPLFGRPRAATVDVISDAKLAVWSREDFEWLLKQNSQMRSYFEELYSHRETRARRPFPGKQWDEVTIIRTRKHPVMLLTSLLGPIFFILVSLIVLFLLLVIQDVSPVWIGIAAGVPAAIGLLWGLYQYIDWGDDEYIVTSKRVIHIERFVFYGEERDEAPLIRIQDVTTVAGNIWERLLNYHDVVIQTAGAEAIKFTGIANADEVKEKIFEEQAKALERREAADVASIRKALAQKMRLPLPSDVESEVDSLVSTAGVFEAKQRKLPPILDYLWPRMSVVEGDTITWRKHWFIWLGRVWPALLLTLTFVALMIPSLFRMGPFVELGRNSWILAVVLAFGAFFSFLWYVYLYDDWHKDVYIATKDRIVDVESSSFRLRGEERREGTFNNIQNITYSIPGFFNKLLNLGSVTIETAGTAETFTFDSVFDPSAVQQEIYNRMVAYQEQQRQQQRVREDTHRAEWFGQYHVLHLNGDHEASGAAPGLEE